MIPLELINRTIARQEELEERLRLNPDDAYAARWAKIMRTLVEADVAYNVGEPWSWKS